MAEFLVIWRWALGGPSSWVLRAHNLAGAVREALAAPSLEEGRRLVGLDVAYRGGWVLFRPGGVPSGWERYAPSTRAVFPIERFLAGDGSSACSRDDACVLQRGHREACRPTFAPPRPGWVTAPCERCGEEPVSVRVLHPDVAAAYACPACGYDHRQLCGDCATDGCAAEAAGVQP